MKNQLLLVFITLFSFFQTWGFVFASGGLQAVHDHQTNLSFVQNKGQWHPNVLYRTDLGGLNAAFLEQQTITFVVYDPSDVAQLHEVSQQSLAEKEAFRLSGHAYKMHFLNAKPNAVVSTTGKHTDYNNYFIGNNPAKWRSQVPIFDGINYQNLYNGIDLSAYSSDLMFKYDFTVSPNIDPSVIAMQYEGVNELSLYEGNLLIKTSVGNLVEKQPYAYQLIDGKKVTVACNFVLGNNNTVSFGFPEGYQPQYTLVIDPILVGATLSGSSVTNYGHCATYDRLGNIYTGAISFGAGYATSPGAFDTGFNGGGTDIAISKYSPNATARIYGTYIGSSGGDYPHSLIVDYEDQIHVLGSTDGANFPTTAGAFQSTAGGLADIVVAILSPTGNTLVASTYVGGNGTDGRNNATSNYGDSYRGEIMIDQWANTFIACGSQSTNFPVTAGAVQSTLNPAGGGGGWDNTPQDGVLFKLNADLSTLLFSTYLGGSGKDMAFGVRVADDASIYVCGTAANADFPLGGNTGAQTAFGGGTNDAFLLHINSDATQILSGTFRGTTAADHAFFLDIDDRSDRILIYGQTEGNMPITPAGTYGQANGPTFITAYDYELTAIDYATTIGAVGGGGWGALVPVAFMVDGCGYVYISGYSAPSGLPVTANALYTSGGFYLGVLEPDAIGLNYGTYYSANHVDGGTSRFDRNGVVYQGVCSGGDFNTTPGAWATNQTGGWDIGVFKIDFQTPSVNAQSAASPAVTGCAPFTVNFTNLGSSAVDYIWHFGDGDTSHLNEPIHTFLTSGTFDVMLVALDSTSCNIADTSYLQIVVFSNITQLHDTTHCAVNGPLVLDVTVPIDDVTYLWNDGSTLPTKSINQDGTYWVTSYHSNCAQVDSFVVNILDPVFALPPDTTVCGSQFLINATHPDATLYVWQDGNTSPVYTATQSGFYLVLVQIEGCMLSDAMNLTLVPVEDVQINDVSVCNGTPVNLDATIANPTANYQWSNGALTPAVTITQSGTYTVTITAGVGGICSDTDEINVNYDNLLLELGDAVNLCPGENATLDATQIISGVSYAWSNGSSAASIVATQSGTYTVTVSSITGCVAQDNVNVSIAPTLPPFTLGDDKILCLGESVILTAPPANANIIRTWQDGSSTDTYSPTQTGTYWLQISSNCDTLRDEVDIVFRELPIVENPILMPNAFSPNTDGKNDVFRPTLTGISGNYEFSVYDRWGQKVFSTTNPTESWDGKLNGIWSETGVYAWYCRAYVVDCKGEQEVFKKGNVTIIK